MRKLIITSVFLLAASAYASDSGYELEIGAGVSLNRSLLSKDVFADVANNVQSIKRNGDNSAVFNLSLIKNLGKNFDLSLSYFKIGDHTVKMDVGFQNLTQINGAYFDTRFSSDVFLLGVNYNVDLRNRYLMPFIHAGVGMSINKFGDIENYVIATSDSIPQLDSKTFGANNYSFAYSVGIGAKYELSEKSSLIVKYIYLNAGKFKSSNKVYEFISPGLNPGRLTNDGDGKGTDSSHSLILGVRLAL